MKKVLLFALSAFILFPSCRFVGGKRIKGNGNLKTEERSVGNFDGVSSNGSFDVYVSTGAPSVRIEAEENLLPHIETFVNGSELRIKTADGIWLRPKRDIKVYISAPSFTKIESNGSGNITSQSKLSNSTKLEMGVNGSADIKVEIEAPEVEVEINGSGNADLKGATRAFKGAVHGSGSVHALDLITDEANVRIVGSGNVDVFANKKLEVHTTGSGNVRYRGEAQISSNTTGSGSVKKVE